MDETSSNMQINLFSDASVGVEHDSEVGAHSSGGKVSVELSSNKTVATVSLDDSAPDNSEFCVVSDALALENVSNSLAKVKACTLLLFNTIDLEKRELLVLGGLSSLEADEACLCVESNKYRYRMDITLTSLAVQTSEQCPLLA